jgi:transposase
MARPILSLLAEQLRSLDERVVLLDRELARRAREDVEAKRLATIPGIGPITATALVALAPAAQAFKRGRDFALVWRNGQRDGIGKTRSWIRALSARD